MKMNLQMFAEPDLPKSPIAPEDVYKRQQECMAAWQCILQAFYPG